MNKETVERATLPHPLLIFHTFRKKNRGVEIYIALELAIFQILAGIK